MPTPRLTRRDLLRRSVPTVGAVAAGALIARPAAAFKLEEVPPTAGVARLYATRCGAPAEHQDIIAALKARLDGKIAAGDAADVERAACPLCGCSIMVSAAGERIVPASP